jgi:CubicO group peptidase (beta-lactamase class C family)
MKRRRLSGREQGYCSLIFFYLVRKFQCMKKIFSLLLSIAFVPAIYSQNSFVRDSLDTYIQREMKRWQVPGLAIAIVKDGKVLVSKGYGVRDLSNPSEKVDANTLFQIASNSKAFTGTSLAMLAVQKRLSLDDKVSRWMPDFRLKDPLANADIRIRDLLCHRIGFETFQSDMLNWGSNLSRKELITNMRNVDPVYSFRSNFGYCNAAFLTAGEIIPLVTDTTWDNFISAHFFKPLGMSRSSSHWADIQSDKNACKPYTLVDDKLVVMPFVNVDNLGPAASINSCVNDLSHWLLMQLDSGRYEGKSVVPFAALQMTRTSNSISRDVNSRYFPGSHFRNYGLGWFLEDYYGKKVISHDGGANGFVTTTCFIPELNLGITVLTNTDANSLFNAIRLQVIDAFMNLPYRNQSDYYYTRTKRAEEAEAKTLADMKAIVAKKNKPAHALKEYAGNYHHAVYGDISIKEEKGKLNIYFSHHPQLIGHLEPLSDNSFLCTYSDPEYSVKEIPFLEKNSKITGVTITVNSFIDFMPYRFERVN